MRILILRILFYFLRGREKDSLGDENRKQIGYGLLLDEDVLYIIGQRMDFLERKMMYATGKSADFLRYRYYELLDLVQSAKVRRKVLKK
jgi:hypothetical protein